MLMAVTELNFFWADDTNPRSSLPQEGHLRKHMSHLRITVVGGPNHLNTNCMYFAKKTGGRDM
jgi:hypothetical protein